MKAVWYERNGSAREVLVYGDMPDPLPGPGEVRVRIAYSGINPSDAKRRAGNSDKLAFARSIPNMDGSGVIDRVGPGVDAGRIGERVWLHSTAYKRPFGTAAGYAVTPEARAFTLPTGVPFAVGAGLGVPAMTAHRAVFGAGPVRGKTVLVTGGAGAVGFYAIGLAKWGGARVIATVSSAEKEAAARRAGADEVVNYRETDVAERVLALTGGAGVDHVVEVDFGGNLAHTVKLVKDGAVVAAYASMGAPRPVLPFYDLMRKNVTLMGVLVYAMPAQAMTVAGCDVNAWLATGTAVHPVARRYLLSELVDAHLAVESGAVIGKVIVEVGGESVAA